MLAHSHTLLKRDLHVMSLISFLLAQFLRVWIGSHDCRLSAGWFSIKWLATQIRAQRILLHVHRSRLPFPRLCIAVPRCRDHTEKQSHLQMQLESPRCQDQDHIIILTYDRDLGRQDTMDNESCTVAYMSASDQKGLFARGKHCR